MGEAESLSDAAVQRYGESSLEEKNGKNPLSLRKRRRGNESIKSRPSVKLLFNLLSWRHTLSSSWQNGGSTRIKFVS